MLCKEKRPCLNTSITIGTCHMTMDRPISPTMKRWTIIRVTQTVTGHRKRSTVWPCLLPVLPRTKFEVPICLSSTRQTTTTVQERNTSLPTLQTGPDLLQVIKEPIRQVLIESCLLHHLLKAKSLLSVSRLMSFQAWGSLFVNVLVLCPSSLGFEPRFAHGGKFEERLQAIHVSAFHGLQYTSSTRSSNEVDHVLTTGHFGSN